MSLGVPADHGMRLRRGVGPTAGAVAILVMSALLALVVAGPTQRVAVADVPPYAWSVARANTSDDTGLFTSIAIDRTGEPYISYIDDTLGRVQVAHRVSGTWTSEIVAGPGSFIGNTNLVIASNGTVEVSFFDAIRQTVQFAFRGSRGWNLNSVDVGYADGYNRLALDAGGRPVLAYSWNNGWLRYATWDGATWARETVDSTTIISRYIGLVVDPAGDPHISYYGDGVLRYATKDRGTWSFEVVDQRPYSGWFSRIGLDSFGILHVGYYDSVNSSLRYAERVNGHWLLSTIDGTDDSGWDLSLAVDSLDRVQIAYYARVRGELRYAVRTPAGWTKETVDTGGVVGWYTGLAADVSGFPHISYYDWTNGDLKYAEGVIALEVRTLRPTRVTSTSATLQGDLVSTGTHASAEVRFAMRTFRSTNWTYWSLNQTSAAGPFSVTVANLTAGQRYEYRAEARAENETSIGEIVSYVAVVPVPPEPPYGILAIAGAGAAVAVVILVWIGRRRRG